MKTKLWTALLALYIVWGSTYISNSIRCGDYSAVLSCVIAVLSLRRDLVYLAALGR